MIRVKHYSFCTSYVMITHIGGSRGAQVAGAPLFELHHRLVFAEYFLFVHVIFLFTMFFFIFALNYTSVSVDFSQLKLFEIQFLFYSKKKVPPPPL
jgi:hypothetical protein